MAGAVPVRVRAIRPGDAQAVLALYARLSERTRFRRYFCASAHLPPGELKRIIDADGHDRETLVAEAGDRIIGVGQLQRLPHCSAEAEVAVVVEDAFQRQGLGSVLFAQLVATARRQRISRIVAELLADNMPIVCALVRAGYRIQQRQQHGGVVRLTVAI